MVSAWRNFKNIFPRPLFIIIFRPEMLKFHPYSNLTGNTMVGFVINCVNNKPTKLGNTFIKQGFSTLEQNFKMKNQCFGLFQHSKQRVNNRVVISVE